MKTDGRVRVSPPQLGLVYDRRSSYQTPNSVLYDSYAETAFPLYSNCISDATVDNLFCCKIQSHRMGQGTLDLQVEKYGVD